MRAIRKLYTPQNKLAAKNNKRNSKKVFSEFPYETEEDKFLDYKLHENWLRLK